MTQAAEDEIIAGNEAQLSDAAAGGDGATEAQTMALEVSKPGSHQSLAELTCLIKQQWEVVKDDMRPIGAWLWQIRDNKLWHGEYSSFTEYCEKELPFGRRRANQIIEAEAVAQELPESGNHGSHYERQLRELAKVPKGKRAWVYEQAALKAESEGKELSHRHVEAAVIEFLMGQRLKARQSEKDSEARRMQKMWKALSLGARRDFMEWVFEKGGISKVWPDWQNKIFERAGAGRRYRVA